MNWWDPKDYKRLFPNGRPEERGESDRKEITGSSKTRQKEGAGHHIPSNLLGKDLETVKNVDTREEVPLSNGPIPPSQ
jgi:hypothetical protein